MFGVAEIIFLFIGNTVKKIIIIINCFKKNGRTRDERCSL